MNDKSIVSELLSAWEETYKKGQLTFWVLLALKESSKCVEDIKDFVENMSDGSMSCEEQSLYRNLRKFQHLEIVSYECKKVSKGPDRKYYRLTETGKELFRRFTERNILIFTKKYAILHKQNMQRPFHQAVKTGLSRGVESVRARALLDTLFAEQIPA